jgi:hypothetical protein
MAVLLVNPFFQTTLLAPNDQRFNHSQLRRLFERVYKRLFQKPATSELYSHAKDFFYGTGHFEHLNTIITRNLDAAYTPVRAFFDLLFIL